MRIFSSILVLFTFACHSPTEQSLVLEKKPMTCLFFFIPDCPASKACMGPIMDLKNRYSTYGLEVTGILSDPNPDDSILNHVLNENHVDFKILRDSSLEMAKKRGASTTPQFFLLDSLGQVIYSGLIDNYYYSFGKHRAGVTEKYLEDAILAYLSGEKPKVKETNPIGCKINFDSHGI